MPMFGPVSAVRVSVRQSWTGAPGYAPIPAVDRSFFARATSSPRRLTPGRVWIGRAPAPAAAVVPATGCLFLRAKPDRRRTTPGRVLIGRTPGPIKPFALPCLYRRASSPRRLAAGRAWIGRFPAVAPPIFAVHTPNPDAAQWVLLTNTPNPDNAQWSLY